MKEYIAKYFEGKCDMCDTGVIKRERVQDSTSMIAVIHCGHWIVLHEKICQEFKLEEIHNVA